MSCHVMPCHAIQAAQEIPSFQLDLAGFFGGHMFSSTLRSRRPTDRHPSKRGFQTRHLTCRTFPKIFERSRDIICFVSERMMILSILEKVVARRAEVGNGRWAMVVLLQELPACFRNHRYRTFWTINLRLLLKHVWFTKRGTIFWKDHTVWCSNGLQKLKLISKFIPSLL